MRMRKGRVTGVVLAVALLLAACGADDEGGSEPAEQGVRGGTLKIANGTDVDYLDPATAYSPVAWTLERTYLRLLYSWRSSKDQATTATPVPDLAEGPPTVSDDQLTYTFKLRSGVRWAPPVNRELVAGDFVYALERLFDKKTPSSGQSYALLVKGAQEFADGKAEGISGMRAVDDRTLEITLAKPAGDFLSILAMGFYAPVPKEEADKYRVGSDYSKHVVGLGPYTLDQYVPEKSISFKRNPNWDPATDPLRKGWVDRIEVTLGHDETPAQQLIERGDADLSLNLNPPVARLPTLSRDPELSKRFSVQTNGCVEYIPLNVHPNAGPTSELKVRQAINYALDKEALLRTRGGPLGGQVASTILPPTQFGHKAYDLYPSPGNQGDVAKAKQLLAEAGYPDGLTLSYVGSSTGRGPAFTTVLQASLARVGIKLNIKTFEGFSVYFDSLLFPAKRREHQLGDAEWCPDYPGDGARSFFVLLFDGRSILPSGNNNMAEYNVPEVNQAIDQALAEPDPAKRSALWAALDQRIMQDAPWAPWAYAKVPFFWSERVRNWVWSPWTLNPDLTNLWLAQGG
jgi:peptide/nickel transport system substrate-binding protein